MTKSDSLSSELSPDTSTPPMRPVPSPTPDNVAFYDAARRGELRFQRCAACGAFRHYPRPVCPHCLSREYTWDLASGRGRVYTWTVVRGPTLPAFEAKVPYVIADILTDEGVHFVSELVDCAPDQVRADLPVRVVFEPVSVDITLVKFRPIV